MLRRQHFGVSGAHAVAGGALETGLVTGRSSPFAKQHVRDEHAQLTLHRLHFGLSSF